MQEMRQKMQNLITLVATLLPMMEVPWQQLGRKATVVVRLEAKATEGTYEAEVCVQASSWGTD